MWPSTSYRCAAGPRQGDSEPATARIVTGPSVSTVTLLLCQYDARPDRKPCARSRARYPAARAYSLMFSGGGSDKIRKARMNAARSAGDNSERTRSSS